MMVLSTTAKGDAKRARILDAARAAFLADGFHATSMQDLFRATGTSPGAFYRYFPSKESLVSALAGDAIETLAAAVGAATVGDCQDVAEALRPAIFVIDELERDMGGSRLALLIWAEAQRSSDLATIVRKAIQPMLDALDRLALAFRQCGARPESQSAGDVAVVLAGILQGYVVQRALLAVAPAAYVAGIAALTRQPNVQVKESTKR